MLSNIEVFKIWAEDGALWTQWAKPIAFVNIEKTLGEYLPIPELAWAKQPDFSTAIIVDLPGKDSVAAGVALAKKGYRPVPLFNGVSYKNPLKMVVPVHEIESALYSGAAELRGLRLAKDAPPAFLLDANRMSGAAREGRFDNRWSVFPQDMPSAAFLISKDINTVIVRSDKVRDDLQHVLYRYQAMNIKIYVQDAISRREYIVSKPSRFKKWLYRFTVMMGLRRNSAGGFGGIIPESSGGG
ncbi:hypothetical protein Dip510_001336 [Elusimicrobium posterum]|uniref:hypothetical protein n=1 Tax=Elusimicrobium posterum TaxID=3116653 RepID=UPI003C721A1D